MSSNAPWAASTADGQRMATPLRFAPSWSRTMHRLSVTAVSAASLMRERNVSFLRICSLNALRLNTNLHRLAISPSFPWLG